MNDPFRGTGRTTGMLKDAIALAESGHRVVVWGWNYSHVRQLSDMLLALLGDAPMTTVATVNSRTIHVNAGVIEIRSFSADRDQVDQFGHGFTLRGYSRYTKYLIDHWAFDQWLSYSRRHKDIVV